MNRFIDRLISVLWAIMILVFCIGVQRFVWRTADYVLVWLK